MIKVYKWHRIAFIKELEVLLRQIEGQTINYLEFRLLVDQAHLVFFNQEEETRCISLFKRFGYISKAELVSYLTLVSIVVKHNHKYHIIRLRQTAYQLEHSNNRCFHFWINHMKERYGSIHVWFEELCLEKDIRRVSLQHFLAHLSRVLRGSSHAECGKKIMLNFEKSRKNEITFSVFFNSINVNRMHYTKSEVSIRNKDSYSCSRPKKNQTETQQTESMRQYSVFRPNKLKIKPKGSISPLRIRYMSSIPLKNISSSNVL